jgi:NitT/TauT family transport system substrate-binding protein
MEPVNLNTPNEEHSSKLPLLLFALGLSLLALAGAFVLRPDLMDRFRSEDTPPPVEDQPEISVGITYYPSGKIFLLAEDLGYYVEEGANVNVVQFEDYSENLSAMRNGSIDMTGLVLFDVFNEIAEGFPFKVVTAIDYSYGADGVIARGIESVEGMRGQTVAVEENTVGQFFLEVVLNRFEMTKDDVKLENYTAGDAATAFIDGDVDIAVTYEPFLHQALFEGEGNIIFDSTKERGLIPSVMIVSEEELAEKKDDYTALFRAWYRAVDFLHANPDEAFGMIGSHYGMTAEEASLEFLALEILDLRESRAAFAYGSGFDSLYGSGRLAIQFLEDNSILEDIPDMDQILDSSVVDSIN